MSKFVISTDSCSDQFKSYLQKNQVHYIVLKRITNGVPSEEIYDSYDEYEKFYEDIRNGILSTTSLLNEYELTEYFENILAKTEGDIIHIPLSSGLSTTCDNSIIAAENLNKSLKNRKIYVVDSLSASRGMAMLVDRLIEMRDNDVSAVDAVKAIEELRSHQQVWAIINDLKHLKRGGRISGFKATVGTLLDIKPILIINPKGKLVIEKNIKGEKKAVEYLLDKIEKYGTSCGMDYKKNPIYIIHSSEGRLFRLLEHGIKDRFGDVKINSGMIGPIIGTHVGDGAVGILFEGAKRLDIN